MSDDRLFASNNPIGRKWYAVNMGILLIITYFTHIIFLDYIIPNVITEVYSIISRGMLYFLYLIYLVTFFALIERRLYDISGSRESTLYKNISLTLKISILCQIIYVLYKYQIITIPVSYSIIEFTAMVVFLVFLAILFVLAFIKGKISGLTYEEYRKKIKYQ